MDDAELAALWEGALYFMDDASTDYVSWEAACTANEGGKAWLCTEGFGGLDDSEGEESTLDQIIEAVQNLDGSELEGYIWDRYADSGLS